MYLKTGIAIAFGSLILATSAQAMPLAPVHPDGMITQIAYGCGPGRTRVGGVCVARLRSATPAGASDGMEALALGCGTTELGSEFPSTSCWAARVTPGGLFISAGVPPSPLRNRKRGTFPDPLTLARGRLRFASVPGLVTSTTAKLGGWAQALVEVVLLLGCLRPLHPLSPC
jgi:hypothetical protein